jgi:hypothetical protein
MTEERIAEAEQQEAPPQDEVTEVTETPEAPETPAFDTETVEEARLFGWKSPEEWQGDIPAGYIDNPDRFLERVQGSRTFKAMEARQEAKLQEQQARLDRLNDMALNRQREQYESKMQDLERQQRAAVDVADGDKFDALEREKQDLKRQAPEVEAPKPQVDPEVTRYVEENEWIKNPVLYHEAVAAIEAAPHIKGRPAAEQIKFAEDTMRLKYPHVFEAPKPAPQRVDGGGFASGGIRAASAFSKLPGDAKAAFKRYAAKGIFEDNAKGQEEYAREYNNT